MPATMPIANFWQRVAFGKPILLISQSVVHALSGESQLQVALPRCCPVSIRAAWMCSFGMTHVNSHFGLCVSSHLTMR